jgi:hypothetical protein
MDKGSVADYLSVLESENLQEYDWMREANASKIAAQRMQGELQSDALRSQAKAYGRQATGSLIKGVGTTFETGMEAGGWFGNDAWYRGRR